jgi:hypothetical protein
VRIFRPATCEVKENADEGRFVLYSNCVTSHASRSVAGAAVACVVDGSARSFEGRDRLQTRIEERGDGPGSGSPECNGRTYPSLAKSRRRIETLANDCR